MTAGADILEPKGATGQAGLRDHNQRTVLSYLRHTGAAPSADIARRTGLSAQTVSNIIRALIDDGLLKRGASTKGKVGKPSVPVSLDPGGAHALGLSIGRRSAELVLTDFVGTPLETVSTAYAYPTIAEVLEFLDTATAQIMALHPATRSTLAGIGVARPGKIWEWLEVVNAPEDAMRAWQTADVLGEIGQRTGLEVYGGNDARSACVAEQLLGRGREFADFAYIFVGAFIGGGLVLGGKVVPGRTGNAASLGPMPVSDGRGGTTELLNVTSLHVLESLLTRDGLDPMDLRRNPDDWSFCASQIDEWITTTAAPLALACGAITSVVEVEAILIDGAMPDTICTRLTQQIAREFDALDATLIERPVLEQASVGKTARSLGAALLPIHARYFLT